MIQMMMNKYLIVSIAKKIVKNALIIKKFLAPYAMHSNNNK